MGGHDTSSGSIYAPQSLKNVVTGARNLPTERTPAPAIVPLVMWRHQFTLKYFFECNSSYEVFAGILGLKSNILGTKQHWTRSLHCFGDVQISFTALHKCLFGGERCQTVP